ncbi:type I-PGING CRISPR-associated protein Cas5p [bacterium]|nr:MAG: type I-PGING CRISPR-associated protein Cas5p [bacterium]
MTLDLTFLREKPDFSARARLKVEALAPLSMVVKMPGKYYRSQSVPSDIMLWAMLENALGWHIAEIERKKLLDELKKRHKSEAPLSGVKFGSLLSWHVRFVGPHFEPPMLRYDDLWSQHLRGSSFPGGSRNYDQSAIPLMNAERGKRVTFSEKTTARKDDAVIREFSDADDINLSALRPYFPQYYTSPTPREYVEPEMAYSFALETSPSLLQMLQDALSSPAAPLYLGASEGWVDATLEVTPQ